jgi:hypothetical protein
LLKLSSLWHVAAVFSQESQLSLVECHRTIMQEPEFAKVQPSQTLQPRAQRNMSHYSISNHDQAASSNAATPYLLVQTARLTIWSARAACL